MIDQRRSCEMMTNTLTKKSGQWSALIVLSLHYISGATYSLWISGTLRLYLLAAMRGDGKSSQTTPHAKSSCRRHRPVTLLLPPINTTPTCTALFVMFALCYHGSETGTDFIMFTRMNCGAWFSNHSFNLIQTNYVETLIV
jgi:hypothetical protein